MELIITINIRIPQLRIVESQSHAHIATNLFPVKNSHSGFQPVERGPVIEISKIMGHTKGDADLPIIDRGFALRKCLGIEYD